MQWEYIAENIPKNFLASHELYIACGYVISHLYIATNGSDWKIINDPHVWRSQNYYFLEEILCYCLYLQCIFYIM